MMSEIANDSIINVGNYNVYVDFDCIEYLDAYLNEHYKNHEKLVIVDENTEKYCLPLIDQSSSSLSKAEIVQVESGEHNKSLEIASSIWETLISYKVSRDAILINLGGGVIGDLGGFVASTYKRGIPFINVPTTLLSQVDASVGGKVGINFGSHKNSIGVFREPQAVFISTQFLETLEKRHFLSGLVELCKHGLIKDRDLWENIRDQFTFKNLEEEQLIHWIRQSVEIKHQVVSQDFEDKAQRRLLNFGHTIGHAIESASLVADFRPLLHGEAVAIGIICESYLSYKNLGLDISSIEDMIAFFSKNFDYYPLINHYDFVLEMIHNDKKNVGIRNNFTLLKGIGDAEINVNCSEEDILESLEFYDRAFAH
ncbi:MAG: 3-dehydroquinate synthase [Flavobacteriales bacterium]|nr:3-dehydroquinate synthase [Flavobacteriales bacterium]